MNFPKLGYHFGASLNKDYSILGSILEVLLCCGFACIRIRRRTLSPGLQKSILRNCQPRSSVFYGGRQLQHVASYNGTLAAYPIDVFSSRVRCVTCMFRFRA